MARPLRLEFSGALYHVTSRGDRQEDIYASDADREMFLSTLGNVCDRYNWACHAYCLMSNHYHLLIETPDANLSQGMRQLNGVYTQSYNRANSQVGHLFQGRYKAILVEKESYLLELSRYIVLNPVRASMVRTAKDWPWSSYRATVAMVPAPSWLTTDWVLGAFVPKKRAIEAYKQFVSQGRNQPAPWTALRNQVFLGSDNFVEKMQGLIDGGKELSEIPTPQRRAKPLSLEQCANAAKNRNAGIISAYLSGGYTMKEVGDYFGLHYSTEMQPKIVTQELLVPILVVAIR